MQYVFDEQAPADILLTFLRGRGRTAMQIHKLPGISSAWLILEQSIMGRQRKPTAHNEGSINIKYKG